MSIHSILVHYKLNFYIDKSSSSFFYISNKILFNKKEKPVYTGGVLGEQYNQTFKLQCSSISNKLEQRRDLKATLQSSKVLKKRFNLKNRPFTSLKASHILLQPKTAQNAMQYIPKKAITGKRFRILYASFASKRSHYG